MIKCFHRNSKSRFFVFNILKNYSIEKIGQGFSKRIYLLNDQKQRISFWNDLPLKNSSNSDTFQCVIEIPFDNLSKMELCKTEQHHPLWQDVRKSKYNTGEQELRYYALFPLFNYGFFPQTWENSIVKHSASGLYGDDDPLDVAELSDLPLNIGDCINLRVLGAFGLIDQGEMDWKILGLIEQEAIRLQINSLDDFEMYKPGRIDAIKNWFINIKTYDGKKKNSIYENGRLMTKEEALEIIRSTNGDWRNLMEKKGGNEDYLKKLEEKRIKFKY